jgi:hypothetical protein
MYLIIKNIFSNWTLPLIIALLQIFLYFILGKKISSYFSQDKGIKMDFIDLNVIGIFGFTVISTVGYLFSHGIYLTIFWFFYLLIFGRNYFKKMLTFNYGSLLQFIIKCKNYLSQAKLNYAIVFLIFLFFILGFEVFCNVLCPTKVGDSIQGYLGSAKWYFQNGLNFNPYNTRYWVFPFFGEINFSFSFLLGNEMVAKFIDTYFALLIIIGFVKFAKKLELSFSLVLISFAFFITYNPGDAGFIWNIGVGKVDIFGTLFSFFSIYFFQLLVINRSYKNVILTSISISLALGTKYSNWIILSPLIIYYLIFLLYKNLKSYFFISILIISIGLLPVLLRNYIFIGNPLAPEELFWKNRLFIVNHNFYTQHGNLSYYVENLSSGYLNSVFFISIIFYIIHIRFATIDERRLFVLSVFSLCFWIFYAGQSYNTYRYWFWILLVFSLCIGKLFSWIMSTWKNRERIFIWLISISLMPSLIVNILNNRRYCFGWEYIVGKYSYSQWQDHNNTRAYSLIKKMELIANVKERVLIYDGGVFMFIDSFNKFSTESELNLFKKTKAKSTFIIDRGFKYIFYRKTGNSKEEYNDFLILMKNLNCIYYLSDADALVYVRN